MTFLSRSLSVLLVVLALADTPQAVAAKASTTRRTERERERKVTLELLFYYLKSVWLMLGRPDVSVGVLPTDRTFQHCKGRRPRTVGTMLSGRPI